MKRGWIVVCLALCLGGAARTQSGGDEQKLPPLLPQEKEIALAESAGPPHIASEATIYVLERGGYVVARQGGNGFACIVGRDRPDTSEPMCFDPEGLASFLPRVLDEARLREEGLSEEEVRVRIAEGFLTGKYRAPRRAGITYMLSKENRVFNGRRVITYVPHVMVFAPNLKNTDIGANGQDPRLPWVLGEGSPHAYIIVPILTWGEASN